MTKLSDLYRAADLAEKRAVLSGQLSALGAPAVGLNIDWQGGIYGVRVHGEADIGHEFALGQSVLTALRTYTKAQLADIDAELARLGVTL